MVGWLRHDDFMNDLLFLANYVYKKLRPCMNECTRSSEFRSVTRDSNSQLPITTEGLFVESRKAHFYFGSVFFRVFVLHIK